MISIIITSYKEPSTLSYAIDAIYKQNLSEDYELIISAPDDATLNVAREWANLNKRIKIIKDRGIGKPAALNLAFKKAKGDIICYLNSCDMLGGGHLTAIIAQFDLRKYDWVYYNDYLQPSKDGVKVKFVELEHGSIGTSSIAHKNIRNPFYKPFGKQITWSGCNGYGHDWKFIERLINKFPDNKKIYGAVYLICHMPNVFDY